MKNTKYQTTADLLREESRLIELMERLNGVRFMKNARARAGKTLACVQSELNRRDLGAAK